MWLKESNKYFCKIENFAYGEINERSFSNPHLSTVSPFHTAARNNGPYSDVIMGAMASQITGVSIVYSTVIQAIQQNIITLRHWPWWGEFTGAGEFLSQRASKAENVSIWWRQQIMSSVGPPNSYYEITHSEVGVAHDIV